MPTPHPLHDLRERGSNTRLRRLRGAYGLDGSRSVLSVIQGPPADLSARRRGLNGIQTAFVALFCVVLAALVAIDPAHVGLAVRWGLGTGFLAIVCFRLVTAIVSLKAAPSTGHAAAGRLPHYTVVVALKDEAAVADQLVARLSELDYPADRLTGYLVVEACDTATRDALQKGPRPAWLSVLTAPPGKPTTKPRALNVALSIARPGLLTVYDAEDQPDPGQLREAAARFAAADDRLGCLQAPLRIRRSDRPMRWLERQFALEYAALFEVTLPALARMGMPLPLGGTSNHFRVEVLRRVGGWDPWNVTEDADLGFRLHRLGYRCDVLRSPTWETPPPDVNVWLPQRARWLKGFMQTWGVHTRTPLGLGLTGLASLHLTLGAAIASACMQGLFLSWICASLLVSATAWVTPRLPAPDLSLAGFGWAVASLVMLIGAARAGVRTGPSDVLTAPVYWAMLSLAQLHAMVRLISQPFHWDKTPHRPDAAPEAMRSP